MKIVIDLDELKELLSDKFDIKKITIAADDIIIDGKPKEAPPQRNPLDLIRDYPQTPAQPMNPIYLPNVDQPRPFFIGDPPPNQPYNTGDGFTINLEGANAVNFVNDMFGGN